MNVLFINCVLSNTGDAAIFEAASKVMRCAWGAGTTVVAQDDHAQRVAALYPHLSVRPSCFWTLAYTDLPGWRGKLAVKLRFGRFALGRWLMGAGLGRLANRLLADAERDYLEAYRRADLVVATGGTYLVEHYDLAQRIFDMQTALAMRRPLVLFTQSLGPFRARANRRALSRIFRAAKLILVRDQQSHNHLRDLGTPVRTVERRPDAAFALADGDLAAAPVADAPLAKARPRVALSVRRWDHFTGCSAQQGMQRYCSAFAALAVHLVAKYDADVAFLSTCQGAPGYHDDSQVAAAIRLMLPEDVRHRVRVDDDFHSPRELQGLLRDFDWVVATRMHLAILTLGVGTPVLPIAYEFKTTALFKSLGYAIDPPHIESLTSENLIGGFEKAVAAYGETAPRLHEAADSRRREAWEVAAVLRKKFPDFATADHASDRCAPPSAADVPRGLASNFP